jgi:preprotein translocase subunit SecD
MLSEQFTFDMRLELKETTPQDQNVEANWEKLGIQNEHLVGVQVVTDEKSQEVAVELLFTEEGRALLDKAFSKNKGKTVGIFVRNLLVSKLKITSGEVSEHVVISGIPSAAVAQIFADDVNVGLHVAFRPIEK